MFKVFVDLDGVLVDFEKGVKAATGKEVHEMPPRVLWSILARSPRFYAALDWTADGQELWSHLKGHNPTVLSGLPFGSWAGPQKREWCERELGPEVPAITCLSREKAQKAIAVTPEGVVPLLIDDRESIRESWESIGGVFVLHRSARESIDRLRALGLD